MKLNANVTEKEFIKREEEESRKRQMAYDLQVSEKKVLFRKEFDHSKLNEVPFKDDHFTSEIADEFKKELDRLVKENKAKTRRLEKMKGEMRSKSLNQSEQKSEMKKEEDKRDQSQQELLNGKSQMNQKKIKNYSRQTFSQSAYRSKSVSFMNSKCRTDKEQLIEYISELNDLVKESDQNIFNETERNEQIQNIEKELCQTLNQLKEKTNHIKRMNDIADRRYKDIIYIDVQANENKKIVNENMSQTKDKLSQIEKLYSQYKDQKSNVSHTLKTENDLNELVLTNVIIKIEENKKLNFLLDQEIALLDEERLAEEKREKESYFIGLYLWSFEEIEKFINVVESSTQEIDFNLYELDQQQYLNSFKEISNCHSGIILTEQELVRPSPSTSVYQNIQLIQSPIQNCGPPHLLINQNLSSSKSISDSKNCSPLHKVQKRLSKKAKKKQIKLFKNTAAHYLDNYEVEPPNFDRQEVISKIQQFYLDHGENIEPTIFKIEEFYKDQTMQCLLLKNQCEELLQQKTQGKMNLKKKIEQAEKLKDNNFFLDISQNSQNVKDEQQKNQENRLEIVQNLLEMEEAMDSGFIKKFNTNSQSQQITTVNAEIFTDQTIETQNQISQNEKQQKVIFQYYLSLVQLVERVCFLVPLIDFKLEQMHQKINIVFEFEYIPQQLLRNCSDLYSVATNGKTLDKEFAKYCESGNSTSALLAASYPLRRKNSNNNPLFLNVLSSQANGRRPSLLKQPSIPSPLALQSSFSSKTKENQEKLTMKKNNSSSQFSYLSEEYQKVDSPSKHINPIDLVRGKSGQWQNTFQFVSEKEKNIDSMCEMIMKDKMAKYILTEQFVRTFVQKLLLVSPEISQKDMIIDIKNEALRLLSEKINSIFINYEIVHSQLREYISSIKKMFQDKRHEIRDSMMGSNQPPAIGGALSLPKSDYIVKSYSGAFEKRRKYFKSEEEDQLQKFARTSGIEKNSLLVTNNVVSSSKEEQEKEKKEAIYKFIHEISDIKKQILRKNISINKSTNFNPNASTQSSNNQNNFNKDLPQLIPCNSSTSQSNENQQVAPQTGSGSGQNTSAVIAQEKYARMTDEDFLEQERKGMKITEKKEYDDFKFSDLRKKEEQMLVEKKKKIVYHRLIQNAETENSRQEQSAIKQFSIDQDILFKINTLENNVQSEITENINGNLKQESTNLSVKYTKEFCALSEGYLKTNAIYNTRKQMSLQNRANLKQTELKNNHIRRQASSNSKKEGQESNSTQYFHKKSRNLSHGDIQLQQSSISRDNSDQQLFSAQSSKANQQLAKINQILAPKSSKTLSTYSTNKSSLNTFHYNSGTSANNISTDEYNSRLQSPSSLSQHYSGYLHQNLLLVQNQANSSIQPIYYKYLQPDYVTDINQPFSQHWQQSSQIQNSYFNKDGSNIMRKAFTTQSGARKQGEQLVSQI